MKKTAALLLALLLAFSLFACGEKQTADAPSSPSGSAPSAEPSPDTGAQASAEPSPDTGAQASTVPEGSGTVGYITDDVDYFARDPYKLVYLYGIPVPISANVFTVLERLGEKMNFSIVSFCADGDMSKYIEYVETYIDMGIDGFLFSPQQDVMPRTDDLCSEAGVPYINMMTTFADEDGHTLKPVVSFDGYQAGANIVDWLVNNYTDYFGDVDLADIGFMTINFSVATEFNVRTHGAQDRYKALHPELADKVFDVDVIDMGFSVDAGFDKAAATMSANSDIKYWFVFGVAEDFAVGAARAVESLGKQDEVLVVSTGNDFCFPLWESEEDTPAGSQRSRFI
jgi:DNA-binding LacI/PurR family transcriptional regulator